MLRMLIIPQCKSIRNKQDLKFNALIKVSTRILKSRAVWNHSVQNILYSNNLHKSLTIKLYKTRTGQNYKSIKT
jgi:hypothetical protein